MSTLTSVAVIGLSDLGRRVVEVGEYALPISQGLI